MADRLFEAYFTEGRDLNDPDVLVACAVSAGLDPEAARRHLASEAGQQDIALSQDTALQMGISGVPFYLFSGGNGKRYGLSGAQPQTVLEQALQQLSANLVT